MTDIYALEARRIDGTVATLEPWRGQVLLIVNTASECGFTRQYAGLQALHDRFNARGLLVLGFPCNQFAGQEPLDNARVAAFCETRFGVTFPLFSKIDVNGAAAHPLWRALKAARPGTLGIGRIK